MGFKCYILILHVILNIYKLSYDNKLWKKAFQNSGNGDFYHDGSSGAYGTSAWFPGMVAGDIISVALDVDASKIWFGKNGTWGNSSDPAAGTNSVDFSGYQTINFENGKISEIWEWADYGGVHNQLF